MKLRTAGGAPGPFEWSPPLAVAGCLGASGLESDTAHPLVRRFASHSVWLRGLRTEIWLFFPENRKGLSFLYRVQRVMPSHSPP